MVKRHERAAWRALGAMTVLLLALLTLPLFGAVGAQDAPTPTPPVIARYLMEVYADGSIHLSEITPTPFPTWTPPPTDTPVPSATPSPTATATATPTSTPSPVDTIEPTQENTPPPTPPGPTQVPKTCRLKNGPANINIRADHNTTASKTGLWLAGDDAVFDVFAVEQDYLWGHQQSAGWNVVAIYYEDPVYVSWWVYGITQGTDVCTDIPGWPSDLQPPAPTVRILDGFHLIVGAVQTLLNYVDRIGTMKGTSSASQIPLMAKQFNPDLVIVYRSLYNAHGQQDCPSPTEWYDAEAYFNALRPFGPMASTITSMRMSAAHRIA